MSALADVGENTEDAVVVVEEEEKQEEEEEWDELSLFLSHAAAAFGLSACALGLIALPVLYLLSLLKCVCTKEKKRL